MRRKDKYEKNVNKYLYETSDTLEYNKEEEETVTHTLEFDVSGPSSAAFPTMREGLVEARETRSRRPKAIKDKEPTDDDDDDIAWLMLWMSKHRTRMRTATAMTK